MRLVREQDGAVVVERLELADRFLPRLRGLMGRRALEPGHGLWLEPCASVHMMFMRFPLDVLFLRRARGERLAPGAAGEVVAIQEGVRPWVGLAACRGASSALEVPAGEAARRGLRPGDRLRLETGSPADAPAGGAA